MKPSELAFHIRDVIILPGTVIVLIPYLIHRYSPNSIPGFLPIKLLSLVLFIIGFWLFIWTNYLFQSVAKGTLAPWTSKKKLITQGPYKYIRNPMITGVLLILSSEFLWLRSYTIMIWAVMFFLITSAFLILVEEPFLSKKFGDEYLRYKTDVPRWIPTISK